MLRDIRCLIVRWYKN